MPTELLDQQQFSDGLINTSSSANGPARTARRRLPNLGAIYGSRRGRTDSQRPLNDSNDSSLGGGVGGNSFGQNEIGGNSAGTFNNGYQGSNMDSIRATGAAANVVGYGDATYSTNTGAQLPPRMLGGPVQRFIFVNRKYVCYPFF